MFKNIKKNYEIGIFYAASVVLAVALVYFLYFGFSNLVGAINQSFLQPSPASANIEYLNGELLNQIVKALGQ